MKGWILNDAPCLERLLGFCTPSVSHIYELAKDAGKRMAVPYTIQGSTRFFLSNQESDQQNWNAGTISGQEFLNIHLLVLIWKVFAKRCVRCIIFHLTGPFPRDESLLASRYSITVLVEKVQTIYIPFFHQFRPLPLVLAVLCKVSEITVHVFQLESRVLIMDTWLLI